MPKTPLSFYLHMIAVAVVVFAVGNYMSSRTPDRDDGSPSIISGDSSQASGLARNDNRESVYDRVMRTGVIRCGYAVWPPTMILKDPNTGIISGIFPEIMETAATMMNLKVEWVEETGWGSFIESLKSDRFDVFCAPLWVNAQRGKLITYSVPLTYSALHFYARADDRRFDQNLDILNSPEFTLATMDGEMSQMIANNKFPNAKQNSIPQLGDITQLLLAVSDGKADGVFLEPSLANDFEKKNPGKIRQITKTPYQIFPNVFGLRMDQPEMKMALDSALTEMINQGTIDRIIEKYEPDRSVFMPLAKPYQLPTN
jgi:polar amino acid transport system substrate-binding protein